MQEIVQYIIELVRTELHKPEWKEEILGPFMKWVFRNFAPYVVAIIFLNFFFTIAAVSLVLYLYKR